MDIRKPLNAETILSNRVVDLRRRYDIGIRKKLYLPEAQRWEARDWETYDPDPEARLHIVGRGKDPSDATADLLSQLAEVAAQGAAA